MSNEKKEDKKKTKQEKKLEKKNLKKSKESLNISTSPSKSPRFFRKNKSTSNIPGDAGQCSPGKKRKNVFKRIGSLILPTTKSVLAPASPPAADMRLSRSQSNMSADNFNTPPPFLPPQTPKSADYKELKVERSNSGKITGYRVNSISCDGEAVGDNLDLKVESIPDDSPSDPNGVIDLVVQEIKQGELQCGISLLTKYERLERDKDTAEFEETAILNDTNYLRDLSFDCGSTRRSSLKSITPSVLNEKPEHRRVSFHEDDSIPDILKMDLAAAIHIPSPPPSLRKSIPSEFEMDDSYNQISQLDLSAMSLKDRCNAQQSLLNSFREKMKATEEENARLRSELSENKVFDIKTIRKQASEVLKENRLLFKEQELREAQWKNIIEERNIEVSRIRSLYSNLEDENDTLTKRCKRLEEKNEEVMKAYNSKVSPVSQNDDFVPVQAHLSSMEGYKVALEELRKKYDDNIFEKKEDVEILEKNVAELTEKLEGLEQEKSELVGQNKGLKKTLTKTQQTAAKYKRDIVDLTQHTNTLKSSLVQAIQIAENASLQKIELADMFQKADSHEKQKQIYLTNDRVRDVKKRANAKIRSCADFLEEREAQYEKNMSRLHNRITKLKLRCKEKDEQIRNLSQSGSGISNFDEFD